MRPVPARLRCHSGIVPDTALAVAAAAASVVDHGSLVAAAAAAAIIDTAADVVAACGLAAPFP